MAIKFLLPKAGAVVKTVGETCHTAQRLNKGGISLHPQTNVAGEELKNIVD